jgi:hypothetical protein
MRIWCQITDPYWELNLVIKLKARQYTSLHLWFVLLMIQPELYYHHDLQIDVDILYLVSLVISIAIFDFFSLDIMEITDLIKCIHAYLFEALTVLLLR